MDLPPMPPKKQGLVALLAGWLSDDEAAYLYGLARLVRDGCVVEIGSFRGRSTAALCYGVRDGHGVPLYAVEPHADYTGFYGGKFGGDDRAAFFQGMLNLGLAQTVRLVNLSSEVITPGWQIPVSLLWVDGDHRYEGVRRDIDCWAPHLAAGATVVFDDINDPEIGPVRVYNELIEAGWAKGPVVGKTGTLYPPKAG